MSAVRRTFMLMAVVVVAALAAMTVMTYRRAGALGFFWPWAWFAWARANGHVHRLDYLGDLGLGFLVFLVPVSIAIFVFRATAPAQPVRRFGANAWAKMADLAQAKLLVTGGDFSGRVFGTFGGRMLVYKGSEPALIVGATRSGKGASHVVPTLLAWPESAFIYDRKGELWEITVDRRKTFSHCLKFDPTDPNTVRWNPLFEVRKGRMEIADIHNVVGILVDPLGQKAGDLNFWDQSATNFFTALILHVLYTEEDDKKHLAEVRRKLTNLEPTLHAMLNTMHRYRPDVHAEDGLARDANGQLIAEPHPEVVLGARALALMDERVKANVIATMQGAMMLWADPLVEYATSTSDFVIGDLVCSENPVSFYLQTPQAHADRLAFLVRVFTRQTINSLMESLPMDGRGRRKNHRLLMLLDEFPKLGALPFLENAMGEMTGYGITPHLVCQSFNDVFAKYGTQTAIFDNMHITAVCATSEPASIKKVIERAGKAREMRESYSDPRGLGSRGQRSVSRSEQQQYILSEEDVRGLDQDKQYLFVNNTKPILAGKIRYWTDPVLAPHAGGFFNGVPAQYRQTAGRFDTPGRPQIDWIGVRAVVAARPLSEAEASARVQADRSSRAEAEASVAGSGASGGQGPARLEDVLQGVELGRKPPEITTRLQPIDPAAPGQGPLGD
jgi:type IV secretion system protein VirD4